MVLCHTVRLPRAADSTSAVGLGAVVIERAGMRTKRIWVAGHSGMAGSAIARSLTKRGDDVVKAGREPPLRFGYAV
jgi:hypothetical protein